uniref:Uncharacterized protein n=1 Tax=Arundo donax TaxID=35708 RepID=A0A0A9B2G2_ARUDO
MIEYSYLTCGLWQFQNTCSPVVEDRGGDAMADDQGNIMDNWGGY